MERGRQRAPRSHHLDKTMHELLQDGATQWRRRGQTERIERGIDKKKIERGRRDQGREMFTLINTPIIICCRLFKPLKKKKKNILTNNTLYSIPYLQHKYQLLTFIVHIPIIMHKYYFKFRYAKHPYFTFKSIDLFTTSQCS